MIRLECDHVGCHASVGMPASAMHNNFGEPLPFVAAYVGQNSPADGWQLDQNPLTSIPDRVVLHCPAHAHRETAA